jgi:hypothetical protein
MGFPDKSTLQALGFEHEPMRRTFAWKMARLIRMVDPAASRMAADLDDKQTRALVRFPTRTLAASLGLLAHEIGFS